MLNNLSALERVERLHREGVSYRAMSRILHVDRTTLERWIKNGIPEGMPTLAIQQMYQNYRLGVYVSDYANRISAEGNQAG